ncbi:MAG: FaeA/PapI family transcriptional regulator [Candidatus Hodarchaeaceae archaeon]|nr:FaeA/PapI family transcriptional regulator [Candidatus Hodarchaeaceae archaeon]
MPKRSLEDVVDRLAKVLLKAEGPLSTREVARRAGVDWKAAQKFLNLQSKFSKAGTLERARRGASVLWRLRPGRPRGTPEMSDRLELVFDTFDFIYGIRDAARQQRAV